ncbi:hypothetical protein PHLCEN_2v4135 [Hermanssonia centrifuga]|uniref:Uncharacterized protein n=1 Tax=Hermanssonia centrifuga TaxID=98765 RepID=A0A2R6PZ78_9APHY|nr:hypothetical protein PHLCEN_2v4135 [Hermanssonia centrifuga]
MSSLFRLSTTGAASCRVHARRLLSTALSSSLNIEALNKWIASENKLTVPDTLRPEHLSSLYATLPTRDHAHSPPTEGAPLGYGHHLVFFHPRNPESVLRWDGTDADFCPPEPFTRRMWASGKMTWKATGRGALRIGDSAVAVSEMGQVKKKGFEEGGLPMVFVKQMIKYMKRGSGQVALEEERSHVYLAAPANQRPTRAVSGLPHPDFSLKYLPSATTLFRFSALTFNGHFIHLDKDYAQKSEGYPERLVHGPLTALMLLETSALQRPDAVFRTFEYRALNPLVVNRPVTIYGAWGKSEVQVWAEDGDGTVGMTGSISL